MVPDDSSSIPYSKDGEVEEGGRNMQMISEGDAQKKEQVASPERENSEGDVCDSPSEEIDPPMISK